jgi:hypothetical protein
VDKSTLEAKLKNIFYAMRDGSKTDAWMAGQIARETKDYILSGDVTTTDTGTAPAGAYTGTGSGKMTIDSGDLGEDLARTFENTGLNSYLASHTADDIDAACTAEDTVETGSSGTVATPEGVPSPFAGKGKGDFAGTKAVIETILIFCFETMNTMPSGGDDYLAAQLASAADTYLTTGKISVTLLPPLTGSGEGAIS